MKPLTVEEIKQALHAAARTAVRPALVRRVCTDSREVQEGDLFVALRGDRFDGHQFVDAAAQHGAVAALVEGNLPETEAIRRAGMCVLKVGDSLEALGRLARYYRRELQRSVRVVAVTGSAGKTTTREMIYHVLSRYKKGHRSPRNYNNAVGVPLTLLGMEPDDEFAVVEIGTNAPGEVAALSRIAEPDVAVITHVGPGHLAGLGDIDGVSREKLSIVAGLKDSGVLVCGLDHKATLERARALRRPMITFGVGLEADVCAVRVERNGTGMRFETNDRTVVELPVGGEHNVKNALAALAVCRRLGLTTKQFAEAMRDFKPVGGRMVVRQVNGITILDDTYNANPSSMEAGLAELVSRGVSGRRIFVCGDMNELGPAAQAYHRALGREVVAKGVDLLLTVGSQAAWVAEAALEAGMGKASVQRCHNAKRMARLIKAMLHDEDTILVKGSRAVGLETVVEALARYRGGRPVVVRGRGSGHNDNGKKQGKRRPAGAGMQRV